jgi:hypothetical protein
MYGVRTSAIEKYLSIEHAVLCVKPISVSFVTDKVNKRFFDKWAVLCRQVHLAYEFMMRHYIGAPYYICVIKQCWMDKENIREI